MRKIFAANWKLHKSPTETRRFFSEFLPRVEGVLDQIVIFPPASSWEACGATLMNRDVQWGAQNIWSHAQGAYTGENSGQILREIGGRWTLVGHSERRHLFGENDAWLADKVAFAQSLELTPVLCIGETLSQREAGRTDAINREQLVKGLAKADPKKPVVVAYEPVWAIGTGQVATPEQVASAHDFVHRVLVDLGFAQSPVLYGGSVKADNASALISIPHVDGFLVGGASLEAASFEKICRARGG